MCFQHSSAVVVLIFVSLFLAGLFNCAGAQDYRVIGYVEDSESGERIAGVHVYSNQRRVSAVTNQYGFYSLNTPVQEFRISVSHISYESTVIDLKLIADTVLTIRLDPRIALMEEMSITSAGENLASHIQMSRHALSMQQVEEIPVLLGESDVLRTLQLLPGLQGGREGFSQIYVRGGGAGQNLILLDGQTVYNPTHVLGIFSIFNSSALKSVELLKGGFPARYGGRLSSVVNFTMKDGNRKRFAGEGVLGILTSKLLIEGPLIKDKASFLFSGRRTFLDLFTRWFQPKSKAYGGYFHDLNFRANYILSSRDHVHVSGYLGEDALRYRERAKGIPEIRSDLDQIHKWGNRLASIRWNRLIGDKIFANLTVGTTSYGVTRRHTQKENSPEGGAEIYATRWHSSITDFSVRLELEYAAGERHYLRGGVEYVRHWLSPGNTRRQAISNQQPQLNTRTKSGRDFYLNEFAIYLEDEIQISPQVRTNIGLRSPSARGEEGFWGDLEPRIGIDIALKENSSIKLSYALMKQYLHRLTQLGGPLSQDQWIPVMNGIPPQRSIQIAAGLAQNFPRYSINVSLEVYRKRTHGLTEFKEYFYAYQAETLGWPTLLEFGEGTSYGLELLAERRQQRLSGWVSYTLAKASKTFSNLNGGVSFPDDYDRRHDISIVLNYQASSRMSFGVSWIYGSGYPVWVPAGRYYARIHFSEVPHFLEYEHVNSARAPSVHRLDVSMQFKKQIRWGKRTFVVGMYNAYNRKNPLIVYPEIYQGTIQWSQLSLFQMIPALSYQIEF